MLCQNPTNQANRDLISDLHKSKPRLTKPTPQTCSTTSRDQNPEIRSPKALPRATTRLSCLRKIFHAPPQIPHSQIVFLVHASPWWPPRPPIYRTWDSGPHSTLHAPSRASRISGISYMRRWTTCTRHPRTEKLRQLNMTSSPDMSARATASDMSASHVSSVASSAPCHLADRWPGLTQPGPPGSDPWALTIDFDPGPVDFDFLHWPLTKSQNFRHGLSCSVFRVDSNFELCFFVWNSKIGQLAHSSLWFLQRHYSWHLQEIFLCLSNLKPSLSFCLEFEGGC